MSDEDDDNEFFDAMQDPAEFITVPADPKYHRLAVTATGFILIFCFIDFPPKSLFFVRPSTRRSGSNASVFSGETGTDDQSVNCVNSFICVCVNKTGLYPACSKWYLFHFFQCDELSLASNSESPQPLEMEPLRKRRTRIPDKPNYYLNLWSIMKNCIGKELSKIPVPVRNLRDLKYETNHR